ncbi:hypothetical protein BT63DRAFT_484320 [Microthyrium microscopicum]|uniref:Integral membrane protein n=1 Tax=Microthyrium microscopicum TaxID=703497 RepID=A0A6A6TVM2_9PEZI|nr:hypothetical protein BT63DRAFT_484320 [Microthyrium microscopicum]
MPSITAGTIYIFGLTSLCAGFFNILRPRDALSALGLPNLPSVRPASDAMALAAIAMGIYYPLAAAQENRKFFALTVGMRLLTATIFWKNGGPWRTPALWEGLGAITTGVSMIWESK